MIKTKTVRADLIGRGNHGRGIYNGNQVLSYYGSGYIVTLGATYPSISNKLETQRMFFRDLKLGDIFYFNWCNENPEIEKYFLKTNIHIGIRFGYKHYGKDPVEKENTELWEIRGNYFGLETEVFKII